MKKILKCLFPHLLGKRLRFLSLNYLPLAFIFLVSVLLNNVTAIANSDGHLKAVRDNQLKQPGDKVIVKGKITSEEGESLPGANIIVKGTTIGTISDVDGNFSLEVPSADTVLVVSFVGYTIREIPLNGRTELTVQLEQETEEFEAVIVRGYGTVKKSLVIGSIAKVESDDIISTAPTRAEQALQGKTAGVSIMQNSGSPGSSITVRVRGTGSNFRAEPLYIVDGMRVSNINFVEPNDIESVEVLKDAASAAIYGAEGANGVVYITTKKGIKGEMTVNYDFYYGWQQVAKPMDMLSAYEYALYKKEAIYYEVEQSLRRNNPDITDEQIQRFQENRFRQSGITDPDSLSDRQGTDWLDELFQVAPTYKHHLSFSGGNEQNAFQASFTYFTQDGVVGGSSTNFTRYTARLNTNHELKKWLDAGTKFTYTNVERIPITENQEYGGLISNAIFIDPLTPTHYGSPEEIDPLIYDAMLYGVYEGNQMNFDNSTSLQDGEGYFGVSGLVKNEIRNPFAQLHNNHGVNTEDRFLGGAYLTLKPIKGLSIRSQIDLDINYFRNYNWFPATLWNIDVYSSENSVIDYMQKERTWQWENYATYTKEIQKHKITLLAGVTLREYKRNYLGGSGAPLQLENDDFAHISATLEDTLQTAYGMTEAPVKLQSYFGRISYDYSEKYLLEFVLRRDGSSLLPKEKRFGIFPSASLGWVISNEDFWKLTQINFLKLRVSWGRNGSLSNLEPFMFVSTMTNQSPGASGVVNNLYWLDASGNLLPGIQPATLSNPGLSWEASEQTDIGVDIGLFKNQVTFTFDYYKKETQDLLAQGGVPGFLGNYPPFLNAGSVENKGYEFELGYKFSVGDIKIDMAANAAYLKNKVTFYATEGAWLGGAGIAGGGTISRFEPGYPVWSFFTYQTDGIFQSWEEIDAYTGTEGLIQPEAMPGDFKIIDVNGDGVINEDDKEYEGSPWPDWTFGFTTNVNYKGFDLNVFVAGALGNQVYNGFHRTDLNNANVPVYYYENRWTPDNHTNDMFRATYSTGDNLNALDFYVEDASWIKLKSLTLGYTLPDFVYKVTPIQRFRIYISAQNLFTFTKYHGMDPEIGNTGATGQARLTYNSIGIDRGFYPSARTYMVGLNVTF
ncbi:MAG: TonB-dependent receptor [Bacteroidales bacterium]|nr:TonB-dependent receptor [Bacteroidales bacterium]